MNLLNIEVEPGFRKANVNNIPTVPNETVFGFVAKQDGNTSANAAAAAKEKVNLVIDYVQVKKTNELYQVRGMVFFLTTEDIAEAYLPVSLKVDTKKGEIFDTSCEQCVGKDSCPHILALVFWLHRKSIETEAQALYDFWGSELEAEEERAAAPRVRDMFEYDQLRLESDVEAAAVTEEQGEAFVNAILDEMEDVDLTNSALYQHLRPVHEEFEPLFIHHTMLNASQNCVEDTGSFVQYMADLAKQGLFVRVAEVSKDSYKTKLWLELQYMRVRCSLIHRIASRKDKHEDEQILESLFCKERENKAEEQKKLKLHKRFILKQTERLENKEYHECGVLLNEKYPFVCATPDGITDDHIVEIKVPKNEEEFEKYMEGHATIGPKYMAQIQIQMYMANVTRALYCVLSPTFGTDGSLHYVWVKADMKFVSSLLCAAENFWKNVAFPRLAKIYLGDK